MNERLKGIDNLVDKLIPNDTINELIDMYKSELKDYDYIDTIELFSLLALRGSMKYINRYDKKLRYGGLLIKVYQNKGCWYGVIKKINGKKYYINFNNNYIFYLENKKQMLKSWATCFISDCEKGLYLIE